MRILFLATASIFLFLMMERSALACDCVTPEPAQAFKEADVVFEGELARVDRASDSLFPTAYTFSVTKVLKGPRAKEIVILGGATNCDKTFFPDIVYRVYAGEFQGRLTSGACAGNEVLIKRENSYYAGVESTSVWELWQLWYVKVAVIAGTALLLVLIVHFLPNKHSYEASPDGVQPPNVSE